MLQTVGRYKILSPLGKGAMGIVYLADDPVLSRQVAVKTIDLGIEDPGRREFLQGRLLRDARAAAALTHPNIVSVFDVVVDGETAGIIMEYVAGENLASYLVNNPLADPAFTLEVIRAMAAALDYTHSRGIIHRDIKPANVMLDATRTPKITDFGIARITDGGTATMPGMVMGTIEYMAPEQIKGETVDGRADQFALGIVAYRMLTGQTLFGDQSIATLAYKIVYENPVPVCTRNLSLPAAIDPVLAKVLAKDPNERYGSCSEFAAALAEASSALDRGAVTVILPPAVAATAAASAVPRTATMAPAVAPLATVVPLPTATIAPTVPPPPTVALAPVAVQSRSKSLAIALCGLAGAIAALVLVWKPWAAPAPVLTKRPAIASTPATAPAPLAVVSQPPAGAPPAAKEASTVPTKTASATSSRAVDRPSTVKNEETKAPVTPNPSKPPQTPQVSAEDSFAHGRDLMRTEDYKGAIEAFTKATDLRPDWGQAYHSRGNAYEALEQYDAALRDYSHAVLLNPRLPLFLASRATCYIKMNRDDAALADLDQAIALKPDGPGMLVARAGIYVRRKDFRKALPDLDEAIRLNPDSVPAHRQRANARRNLGDRPGAKSDSEKANELAAQKKGG